MWEDRKVDSQHNVQYVSIDIRLNNKIFVAVDLTNGLPCFQEDIISVSKLIAYSLSKWSTDPRATAGIEN